MSPREPVPIRWMDSASEDMSHIADYLLDEGLSFDTVEDYVKRIYDAPKHLATLPGAGKPGRMPNTREWLVKIRPMLSFTPCEEIKYEFCALCTVAASFLNNSYKILLTSQGGTALCSVTLFRGVSLA